MQFYVAKPSKMKLSEAQSELSKQTSKYERLSASGAYKNILLESCKRP